MHPAVAKILPVLCRLPVADRQTLLATIAESVLKDGRMDMKFIVGRSVPTEPVLVVYARGQGVTMALRESIDALMEDISHVCDVTIETRKCEGADDDGAADHAI